MKRDMIAIKHEIDSVQLVKDEIDDIRESLDRLEAESQRRKNKLLEQVNISCHHQREAIQNIYTSFQGLTFFLAYSIFSAVLGMLQFGYNTGVINAPEQVWRDLGDPATVGNVKYHSIFIFICLIHFNIKVLIK